MIDMLDWKIRVNNSGNVYGLYILEEFVMYGFVLKYF